MNNFLFSFIKHLNIKYKRGCTLKSNKKYWMEKMRLKIYWWW